MAAMQSKIKITTAIKPSERREKKHKIRIVVQVETVDFTV